MGVTKTTKGETVPTVKLFDLLADEIRGNVSRSPTCQQQLFVDEHSQTLADLADTWRGLRSSLGQAIDLYETTAATKLDTESLAELRAGIDDFHVLLATRMLPLGNV